MTLDRDEVVDLLGGLSQASAPSGFEDEVVSIVREFCDGWATVEENSLHDVLITPRNARGDKPRVMLDAHGDEVGGMVKAVRDNGTLSFVELGRFSAGSLVGQTVRVRSVRGTWVRGVIGAKPPHFVTEAEKAAHAAPELVVDVGARSREEAEKVFGMAMGEPLVPDTHFSYDAASGTALGKAFDCRAGVTALLLALRELSSRDDLAVDVVASVSAQEEVGERGVAAAVRHFDPRAAFLFEGCPASDTFPVPGDVPTSLHAGPMFRYFDRTMITNPRYQRFVLAMAEKAGVACQTAVREGGGTNGGVIHQMDVPCVVAGVPCRYIHSGCSVVAVDDVEAAAVIAVATMESLSAEVIASF